jgi:hypothetical protein
VAEMKAFVFAVSFVVLFSVLVATIPAGLQGAGETPDMLIPVDPSSVTGYSDTEDYQKSDFVDYGSYLEYLYPAAFAGRDWRMWLIAGGFELGAKIYYGGFAYLGAVDSVKFTSTLGVDRGSSLSFAEIDTDAEEGVVRYDLQYLTGGSSAGDLIMWWNTTTYDNSSSDAWDADALFIVHGIGFGETVTGDVGSLLIQLLLLQLPDVPLLINILLITPIWASIIYILWYIIKEMIPFV